MDAQQQHDHDRVNLAKRLGQATPEEKTKRRQKLEDLLKEKSDPSSASELSSAPDAISSAMKRHPSLTAEEAVRMAEDFGF